ncbi:putative uncharacterized protein ['Chrysanthemum coronarium' phytoplasma]|uniref:Uncharacterized protein n=1 Tax='Chrysanthemum coronarium' phytoplasma TaxID=1520703 RepID=A0ABQ0J2B5_9MOLU|nr:putative uncharacterized protein ['Chrysanthemum coronarium' phytoplasma]
MNKLVKLAIVFREITNKVVIKGVAKKDKEVFLNNQIRIINSNITMLEP